MAHSRPTLDFSDVTLPLKPSNLVELRKLVVAISSHQVSLNISNRSLAILGRMVEHPGQAAVSTITELAQALDVHASTLSRLVRTLGFSGFTEFQKIFRDAMSCHEGGFYSDQGSRLLSADDMADTAETSLHILSTLFHTSIRNTEACLAGLDPVTLNSAALSLARARRIHVYGVRQMHAVAALLTYGLGLVRSDVALLDAPGQGVAETLAHMGNTDVLVVSSTSPYSRTVADTAAIAKRNGITVIAITDYRSSPLAASADHTFYVPHQSSFISNSIGAYIVLCEGLINLVARQLGESALLSLKRHEQFIKQLHVETG